ncbi:MAG TPA: helix-turn-helix domain-containing protein [Candidatus Baltobacterales bacterium]|nr:helix-turn-helix domain-containing protein [Candidatus Baltobacterales bacterium]
MKGQQVGEEEEPISLLVTIDEAARRLSIGRSHIYEQIQRGTLRSVRIGRSRRILNRDLEAFIENRLGDSTEVLASAHAAPSIRPVNRVPSRAGRR